MASSGGAGFERIASLRPSVRPYRASCRIVTGPLSDCWGRKGLIVAGMWVPAAGRAPIALMMRERH
ncbi:hypothetical protein DF038_28870 [Burkholderia cepacia]|nr:hypothetical protein DF038_28870 [Burkholderia cepacia]